MKDIETPFEMSNRVAYFVSQLLNDLEFNKLSIAELMLTKGYLDFMLDERIRHLNKDYLKTVSTKKYWRKENVKRKDLQLAQTEQR
jgi:hypothetical protein